MGPIELLMEEHRTIEGVLRALQAFATGPDLAAADAREEVRRFATFFREGADRVHHGKEEDILFAAMAERGLPREAGPLAVMLAEHREGRARTAELGRVGEGTGPLDPREQSEVTTTARAYAALLQGHILKEDQVLYPMADTLLGQADWASVERAFEAFAATPAIRDGAKRLGRLARDLISRHAPR